MTKMGQGKQPIRTRYLGHVTPIVTSISQFGEISPRSHCQSIGLNHSRFSQIRSARELWSEHWPDSEATWTTKPLQELTETSKQPIITRYLGHVTSYQPIIDQYFLIRKCVTTNQNSLFRSRDWLSANQGPVLSIS
eukprot:sb/3474589/